jgi:hypothetical protein
MQFSSISPQETNTFMVLEECGKLQKLVDVLQENPVGYTVVY